MNPAEATECLDTLCRLFPQADLQREEMEVFRDAITSHDKVDCLDAIKAHRLKCDFNRPKFNHIIADLMERKRKDPSAHRPTEKFGTMADIIRRENPHLANDPDAALLMRYHRYWWNRSNKSDSAREGTIAKCKLDLRQCRLSDEVAQASAEWCVADEHGYQLALDEVRGVEIPSF